MTFLVFLLIGTLAATCIAIGIGHVLSYSFPDLTKRFAKHLPTITPTPLSNITVPASAYFEHEPPANNVERESAVVNSLTRAGLLEDAKLLDQLFTDRDAILKKAKRVPDRMDAQDTKSLILATAAAVVGRGEEILDLERRVRDPLLPTPENSDMVLATLREDLKSAYVAFVDTRTRLRREIPLARQPQSVASDSLTELVNRLQDNVEISNRVRTRMADLDSHLEAAEREWVDEVSNNKQADSLPEAE